MDNLTKKQRTKCMKNIRSKDTKPEMVVRKVLTKLGVRYRLHSSKLPGKPDITIPKLKKVIFINGCFWHQHKNCKYSVMPKTNDSYWTPKFKRNVEKQIRDIRSLKSIGNRVYILWECEIKDTVVFSKKVKKIFSL